MYIAHNEYLSSRLRCKIRDYEREGQREIERHADAEQDYAQQTGGHVRVAMSTL